jgi:hypothetical protein
MFPVCSLFNFRGIFNVPKFLRFLNCGVLCLNFSYDVGLQCSDSGFLGCSCNVWGTSLVEQCPQVSVSTASHKTRPNKVSFLSFS